MNQKKRKKVNFQGEDLDDLYEDFTDDEEKLIQTFLEKRDNKAKQADEFREKYARLMDLNKKMRQFDFNHIRGEELEKVNADVDLLNEQWSEL